MSVFHVLNCTNGTKSGKGSHMSFVFTVERTKILRLRKPEKFLMLIKGVIQIALKLIMW